jgi:hypothetical protein
MTPPRLNPASTHSLPLPELPRRQPYSTLAGSAVILLIALFFGYGLPFISARIPGVETVAADTRIKLGRGVSYATTAGWSLDLVRTKPDDTSVLVRDASSFAITTFDWTGTEAELLTRGRTLFEGMARLHVYGDETPFRTANGQLGVTFTFDGDNVTGRVWVILLNGRNHAIAARVRGVPGHLDAAHRDAQLMVDGLQVEASP